MKKFLALVLLSGLLSGCVQVGGKLQTFQQISPDLKGKSLAVVASPPALNDTLEFATYRKLVEPKFAQQGFVITEDVAKADLVAVVSYGIDSGRTQTDLIDVPQYGQTSPGGTTFYNGTINTMNGPVGYSGNSYTQPTYGITGSTPVVVHSEHYRRFLAMQIVDGKSLDQQKIKPYYEGTLNSAGTCGSMSAVFPKLLDAFFQGWPQANDSTVNVRVSGSGMKC